MAQLLKVNNTTLRNPQEFSIEKYDITKAGRVANGAMTLELVAKKRKFLLRWEVISGTDLAAILAQIDTSTMFFTFSYVENGSTKTAECYSGAKHQKQFRTDGVWYWTDVSFDFIEQ